MVWQKKNTDRLILHAFKLLMPPNGIYLLEMFLLYSMLMFE